jgi:hypothetical protein
MHLNKINKAYYAYVNNYLRNTGNSYDVVKMIGTKSKTGSIYMCRGRYGIGRVLKFACKRYKENNLSNVDIILSIKLSALSLNSINPHFNMVYKLHNNSLLTALATGDLKSFLSEYIRYDIMVNCLQQILLCIFSFHRHTEMFHNDCYHGNFIYHRVPKGGVMWYNIGGTDVYIENMGYVWMINDFDMASDEEGSVAEDYKVGMEAFVNCNRQSQKFKKLIKEVVAAIAENGDDSCSVFKNVSIESGLFHSNVYKKEKINKIPYIL